jgi:hypothetical protein
MENAPTSSISDLNFYEYNKIKLVKFKPSQNYGKKSKNGWIGPLVS